MSDFIDLGVDDRLLASLGAKGIGSPTDVQTALIPLLLAGKDALVCAETGSGKTLAYLLPILGRITDLPDRRSSASPFALVLLPTRELADQVFKEADSLIKMIGGKAALISGGQEFRYQASLLRRNPEVVVATPGRLLEHLQRKSLDLSDVEILVLDEADRMLDMGFRDDVLKIAATVAKPHQSVMLSATLKHRGISAVAKDLLENPERILLSSARQVNANIKLEMILADDPAHKVRLVLWLLANEVYERAIIFVKTRERTEELARELQRHQHRVSFLHGEISQDERRKIMAGFRQGKSRVLVATDLAARGLDIAELELVINLDMAHSGEEFIHRAGRTGRAGSTGRVISLVSPQEWNLSAGIQRFLSASFTPRRISGLEGQYRGPKKVKTSGKAAGKKKRKSGSGAAPGRSAKRPGAVAKKSASAKTSAPAKPRQHGGGSASDQGFGTFKPGKR